MSGDDQSFAESMNLCGNHFAKRPRTEEEDRPSGRQPTRRGQKKPSRSSDSDLGDGGSLISMLAKWPSTGGSIEPGPSRQELHLLRPGRKRQHSATNAKIFQGLAWAEGIRTGHNPVKTTHVPLHIRGIGLSSFETTFRIKRSRIDPSPAKQANIDCNQLLELPSIGYQ